MWFFYAFLVALGLMQWSCKSRDHSDPLHAVGEPTPDEGKWFWADVSLEEFHQIIAPYLELGDQSHFSTNELSTRFNDWLLHIHKTLDKSNKLKDAPMPYVLIRDDAEANAFVPPVNTCFNLALHLPGSGEPIERATLDPAGMISDVDFTSETGEFGPCLERTLTTAAAKDFVAWYNRQLNNMEKEGFVSKPCSISLKNKNGVPTIYPDANCPIASPLQRYSGAKKIVFWQTANTIVVHAGLVTFFKKEEMILSTLAHEISHYYRSHTSVPAPRYDYFYTLRANNPDGRPKPVKLLRDDGKKIVAAAAHLNAWRLAWTDAATATSPTAAAKGYKVRSDLFETLRKLASAVCEAESSCHENCISLAKRVNLASFNAAMAGFPGDATFITNRKTHYRKFENDLLACAPHVPISGHITKERIKNAMTTSGLTDTFTAMGISVDDALHGATNLNTAIAQLNQALLRVDAAADIVIADAIQRSIGMYTIEQEADEMAVEILYLLGYDPKALLQYDIEYYSAWEPADESYDRLSMAACTERMNDNWRVERRVYFPPVGDYFDNHHSSCFRIYTSDKEIAVVKKNIPVQPAKTMATLSDKKWSDMQKTAQNLIDRASAGTGSLAAAAQRIRSPRTAAKRIKNCAIDALYQRQIKKRIIDAARAD